jgi:hypothetical protein
LRDRLESAIVCLVLAAVGLVLMAPLLGRYGSPVAADVAVGLAAASGFGAFFASAYDTLRATRKVGDRTRDD